jgi:UDP-N-acetylmuramate dehydrogenase
MNNIDFIRNNLNNMAVEYDENVNLKYHTYFMYGGFANFYIKPTAITKLENVISFFQKNDIEFIISGNTSNLIFLETVQYNIIISTKFINSVKLENDIVTCDAGVMIGDLSRIALLKNCKGFEGLEGIPGTIGGGLFMNAGAYGSTISDNLISVKAIGKNCEIFELIKDDCNFKKRHSIFKVDKSITVLSAKFSLKNAATLSDRISDKMEIYHIARHSYQEFVYPNLGSMLTLNSCIYKEVLKRSLKRKVLFFIFRALFTNKIVKFVKRKRPSNRKLNGLFVKSENIEFPISHKSINILVNDGEITDEKILNHLIKMGTLAKKVGEIENEVVFKSVAAIETETKNKLELLMKI